MQASIFLPFFKGGAGGDYKRLPKSPKIPLNPPLEKGDLKTDFRAGVINTARDLGHRKRAIIRSMTCRSG